MIPRWFWYGSRPSQFGNRMTPTPANVIYPELPDPLTSDDLQQLFSPSFDERQWAPTVVRVAASQVALLVQLKIFLSIGRFRPAAEIPDIAIAPMAWTLLSVEVIPQQYHRAGPPDRCRASSHLGAPEPSSPESRPCR